MRMILAPPIATNLDSPSDHIKRPEVGLSGAVSYMKTYTIMGILGKPMVNKPLIKKALFLRGGGGGSFFFGGG